MNRIIKKCIILLVIIALITLVGCGGNKASKEYEKGSMNGLTYTNKWLDIEVTFPEGCIAASDEDISALLQQSAQTVYGNESIADGKLDYGFLVIDDDQVPNYQLSFENLTLTKGGADISETKYLEEATKPFLDSKELKYKLLEEGAEEIAGKKYAYYKMSGYDGIMYQDMYVHKIENRMVSIAITYIPGQEFVVKQFIDSIKNVN